MSGQPGPSSVPAARTTPADEEGPRPVRPAEPGLDGPLLSDAAGLHERWQQAQAQFVEDPREALSDADDLLEQTAQALVDTLRQRQRQLRLLWHYQPSDATADEPAAEDGEPGTATNGTPDTEQLRLVMQGYRALFSELCRP